MNIMYSINLVPEQNRILLLFQNDKIISITYDYYTRNHFHFRIKQNIIIIISYYFTSAIPIEIITKGKMITIILITKYNCNQYFYYHQYTQYWQCYNYHFDYNNREQINYLICIIPFIIQRRPEHQINTILIITSKHNQNTKQI